jgi:hypothetical protein
MPDQLQNVLEELAITYPDYSKALDKLKTLRQNPGKKNS